MSSVQETKTIPLYVDSAYRDGAGSTNSNDYILSLRKTIRRVRRATIASVEIPKTFDNIHTNNNVFMVVIEKFGILTVNTIEIPVECNILLESVAFVLKNELLLLDPDITWDVVYVSQKCSITIEAIRTSVDVTDVFLIPGPANHVMGYSFKTSGVVTFEAGNYVHRFISSVINLIPTHLIITSTSLSNFINTSYINSTSKTVKIDSTNNELKITEWTTVNDRNPMSYTSIVIPSGFYMLRTIGSVVETYLSDMYNKYTVLFNDTRMGISLEKTPPAIESNSTFSIDPSSSMCEVLGWVDFPLPVDMQGVVEYIGNTIEMSVFNNMLYKIPLNSNISNTHSYTPTGVLISSNNIVDNVIFSQNILRNENDYAAGFSVDMIDLQLRYPNEMLVDLNNAEWSATLLIDTNQ
jgi:hypothetical protein